MKIRLRILERWIFTALLFLLPSQLALHFWPPWAFIFGIRVDYLAPAIYLSDVLVTALIIFWIIADHDWIFNFFKRNKYWFVFILSLAVINTLFSSSKPVSIIRWVKITELLLFAIYVLRQKALEMTSVIMILFSSAIFFSLIGIVQFLKGGTLGGGLYFLGERTFNSTTPGIALVSIFGSEFIRAYSTFSHPNSLAGYLGIILIVKTMYQKKFGLVDLAGILIIGACFILSFSLAAFFALTLVYVLRGRLSLWVVALIIFLSLLLPLVSKNFMLTGQMIGESVSQRLDLAFVSGKMISEKFLIGEGVGTFTANVSRFKGIFSYEWTLQPVHNIFLLVLAETGIVGFLVFCYGTIQFFRFLVNRRNAVLMMCFVFIVLTGFLDHYWLTLQQNLLLLSLLCGLSFKIGSWRAI